MAVPLSLEAVREFLLSHDGKVKQNELIDAFRELTSRNEAIKTRARQEFKDILHLITVAKVEDGVKYIFLTKQHQDVVNRKAKRERPREKCNSYTDHLEEHLLSPFASQGAFSQHTCSGSESERTPPPEKKSISSKLDSLERTISGTPDSPSQEREVRKISASSKPISAVSALKDAIEMKAHGSSESLNSEGSDFGLHDQDEIPPEEKEWLLASCSGKLETLQELLLKFPSLLDSKDFIFGYTALHWAAKLGRTDIVDFITKYSIKGTSIHIKSHGGFTALHIASMSGKDNVINQLIGLGADIHSRDYSGKKPKDVVKETVAAPLQNKLGRSLIIDTNTILQTNLTIGGQRNKKNRRSLPGIYDSPLASPMGSPDQSRKRVKSVGVGVRTVSFLKVKKKQEHKLTVDDIRSPISERQQNEE